ncbi:unnamed protein product [Mytilus coruscus]|uniref:EF-hand domain-containing protein n=1 Tax=Mytilus coruscus TaxID=42192 RepID=A0A6J8DRW7_MYTCO|nr:unnamed protein product [Mytilus coruscus]
MQNFLESFTLKTLSRPTTTTQDVDLDLSDDSDADEKKPIEDDQETLLDLSVKYPDYDNTGSKTYEKACRKFDVVPSSKITRKMDSDKETTLDLKHYGLDSKGTMAVAMAMVVNTTLTKLNLKGNNIGESGMLYIQVMMSENTTITSLDISENNLKSFGAKSIGMMLHDNKFLRELNIGGNGFTDLDAPFLTKKIEEHMALHYLNLSHNLFGDLSGNSFEHMIAENVSLEELDLSWNQFRIIGAKKIASGLKENDHLKIVNASWNGYDDDGGAAFGDVLANNKYLIELDISCCRIGPEGFGKVMKGLKSNDTLEVLKIGKNNIPDSAVETAVDLLLTLDASTFKLECLDLSDVMLTGKSQERLAELKEPFPELEIIHGYTDSYGKRRMVGFGDMGQEALLCLKEYLEECNMTVTELFSRFDEDGSNSVDYDEFRQGIRDEGIPLSSEQVDHLIKYIDIDGDGDIDFSELVLKIKEITKKRAEEVAQRDAESAKRRR